MVVVLVVVVVVVVVVGLVNWIPLRLSYDDPNAQEKRQTRQFFWPYCRAANLQSYYLPQSSWLNAAKELSDQVLNSYLTLIFISFSSWINSVEIGLGDYTDGHFCTKQRHLSQLLYCKSEGLIAGEFLLCGRRRETLRLHTDRSDSSYRIYHRSQGLSNRYRQWFCRRM